MNKNNIKFKNNLENKFNKKFQHNLFNLCLNL